MGRIKEYPKAVPNEDDKFIFDGENGTYSATKEELKKFLLEEVLPSFFEDGKNAVAMQATYGNNIGRLKIDSDGNAIIEKSANNGQTWDGTNIGENLQTISQNLHYSSTQNDCAIFTKNGNIATCSLFGKSITASGWYRVCDLPSGYTPPSEFSTKSIYFICTFYTSGADTVIRGRVYNNGIYVYSATSKTGELYGQVSYPIG